MTVGTSAEAVASAAESVRPDCRQPSACKSTNKRRVTHCRACVLARTLADPVIEAKRRAAVAQSQQGETFRERHRAACKAAADANMRDPAFAAFRREQGLQHGASNFLPFHHSPERRARATAALVHKCLGWCPPEKLEAYLALRRKGIRAPEARRLIEEEIEGTAAHASRIVASNILAGKLKHERDRAQAY